MSLKPTFDSDTTSLAPSEATTLVPGPSGSPSYSHLTKYNMYYTPSMLNCTLHTGPTSSPAAYYMQSKTATLTPRILLHRGPNASKSSPIVAFAKARYTSFNLVIGLGDCEDKKHREECSFEELSRDKNCLRRSDWRFSTEVEGEEEGDKGKRVEIVWRKDMGQKFASAFDAVDGEGRVVGRMLSGGSFNWEKGGEVHVDESLEMGLRDLLVVSAFGIWVVEALNYRSLVKAHGKEEHGKET